MTRNLVVTLALLVLAGCGNTASGKQGGEASNFAANGAGGSPSEVAGGSVDCNRFSPAGKPPQILNEKLADGTQRLCYRSFAVGYSTKSRTPIWSAEYLTTDAIDLAHRVTRIDDFHPEMQLAPNARSELSDYRASGYDRGHMAPNGDMPTPAAALESFTLTNIAPQAAGLNRRSWEDLEKAVRRQTRGGPVFVVTGPLFAANGGMLKTTHTDHRVFVPTHVYKAIYALDRGATVFIATNEDQPRWESMTVDQFTQVYRIDPFPGMQPKFRTVNGATDGSLSLGRGGPRGSNESANSSVLGPHTEIRDRTTGQTVDLNTYHLFHGGRDPGADEIVHY